VGRPRDLFAPLRGADRPRDGRPRAKDQSRRQGHPKAEGARAGTHAAASAPAAGGALLSCDGVSEPVLKAHGLVRTVGVGRAARRLLDGVGLEVHAGEVVAILGRSGSGKSTLLHLLGGLDRPDAGSITVAGECLVGRRSGALARIRLRHIGFVFQQFQLIEELSGLENVLLATQLPGAPGGGARRARALIDSLGLAAVADHLPHELSGGEQQRIAIARALVNEPELVLADEPTGSLDAANGSAVLEILRSLPERAVVIVTHEPEAAAIADRVLTLRGGRLVADARTSGRVRVAAMREGAG